MTTISYLAQAAVPLIWPAAAVLVAALVARRSTSPLETLQIWQRCWAIIAMGCGGLWMTISFLLIPDVMAAAIGFARTPFMVEIAVANLGLAVMGFRVASASASARERITVGLGAGMFLWGAVLGHVYQWLANGDTAPGNVGGVLLYDVAVPAVMIGLAVAAHRREVAQPVPAPVST